MNILIIEDLPQMQEEWKLHLEKNGHTVVQAFTPSEALDIFEERTDWDIIVLDGCIGDTFNCLPVLHKIRQSFNGLIIAASSDAFYRKIMIEAGCTRGCEKISVLGLIKRFVEGRLLI